MTPFLIPVTHDLQTCESLARWEILRKAGRFEWDDKAGGTCHQMPTLPQYVPIIEALRDAGMDPVALAYPEHDAVLAQLREHAVAWSMADAASAFVAGLWSAPAAWRSALAGVLLAQTMPEHSLTPYPNSESRTCQVCGYQGGPHQTLGEWAFRLTEGNPLDGEPIGYAQVLGWLGDARPEPSEYDRWALGAIIAVLRALPEGARYSAAVKAIHSANILRGQRTPVNVLEALALIGVLAPPDWPGLAERFTSYRERDQRPSTRVEVQAPLAWWSTSVGDHGIRREVFEQLFGALDIPAVDLDAPRPASIPAAQETIDGGLAARIRALTPKFPKAAASVGVGPAAAGDVWAIRLKPGRWVTVYVHEVRNERGRPYAMTEFLAGVFSEQATAAQLRDRAQPRKNGRWAMWTHSLEKTPWVRRVAQGMPAPSGEGARPEARSYGSAEILRGLAGWCFDFE